MDFNTSATTATKTDISVGSRIGTGVILGLGVVFLASYLMAGLFFFQSGKEALSGDSSLTDSRFQAMSTNHEWHPVMSGEWIAWIDMGDGQDFTADVYTRNIRTGQSLRVTEQSTADSRFSPAIEGDRIVWMDLRGGEETWDLYQYTISTGETEQLTDGVGAEVLPEMSGNKLVWTDTRNGQDEGGDIYLMDLTTQEVTPIVVEPSDQSWEDIHGDIVTWVDAREGLGGVYFMNLNDRNPIRVSETPNSPVYARTDGHTIVWTERHSEYDSSREIFLYDIASQTRRQLTNDAFDQWLPDVQDGLVTWMDLSDGDWEIYTHTIATGATRRITNDTVTQAEPRLARPWMVWTDFRNGNADVYLYRVDNSGGASPSILKTEVQPASAAP